MSSKSYSTTHTNTSSISKTLGAEGEAIIADDGATINVLDEGAIEDAFNFAQQSLDANTDTAQSSLELAGIYSTNESNNLSKMLDTVKTAIGSASNLSAYALEQQAHTMDSALIAAGGDGVDFTELSESNTTVGLDGLLSSDSMDSKTIIGYGAGILFMFMLWQGIK